MSIEATALGTVVRLTKLELAREKVRRAQAEHELAALRLTVARTEEALRAWESRTGNDGFGLSPESLGRWLERVKLDVH